MLVKLKRPFFVGGTKYEPRSGGTEVPEDAVLPKDAEVIEVVEEEVPKKPSKKSTTFDLDK